MLSSSEFRLLVAALSGQSTPMESTRREVLTGAAAIAATAVLPAVPQAATPAWLLEARAALLAKPLLGWSSGLSILGGWCADHGGAEPEDYDLSVKCSFARALDSGTAELTADGRLVLTELGREELRWEWLESSDFDM
jgi:hypothetical protein